MARMSSQVCACIRPDPEWHAKGTTRLASLGLAEMETGPKACGEACLQDEQLQQAGRHCPQQP